MRSTFHGLETARRGMTTQQTALNVLGHNIANANTPGYTRQRVDFVQTEPYPPASINRPEIPGQMGTGVEAGEIQRIRDRFLDIQYRSENSKLGYWESRAEALSRMEDIMNEPSDSGLSSTIDAFWKSLEDLAVDPSNSGARSVVRENGRSVAQAFNYIASSLQATQQDFKDKLDHSIDEINTLATLLNNVNQQIAEVEPHGLIPNDLYDERDRLLDQISNLANIEVSYTSSGGHAPPTADGIATVTLVDDSGNSLGTLVDTSGNVNALTINYNATNGLAESIDFDGNTIGVDGGFASTGSIRSLIDSYGYTDGTSKEGVYPGMIKKIDEMAYAFATEFNNVHQSGWNINDIDAGTQTPVNFFEALTNPEGAAALLQLSAEIEASTDNIAASATGQLGDGGNAVALAEVKNNALTIDGKTTNLQDYYEGVIGEMAVISKESIVFTNNVGLLLSTAEENRLSVSSVSLDEEFTNMIKFQHAYNASARNITTIDEMLDRVINGMGIVGR
ncbi:flagellar hook-associated protein FlgK [Cytobacillus sp. IB215316]|uniref:flagellar hook-associated protein FlgK n=1 Tax=Cytobacillus sp. IB215316 TaxID=3097354 RepID=UPI002A1787AA|nr:flagellar hook-associated protein FlgK [Cytobacillus sp. IB215316]MDX8361196.1 flagellar hook-associated protein FlgK [Cytobacillus sp. IB215316]